MIKTQGSSIGLAGKNMCRGAVAIRLWIFQLEVEQLGQSGIGKTLSEKHQRIRQLQSKNHQLLCDFEILKKKRRPCLLKDSVALCPDRGHEGENHPFKLSLQRPGGQSLRLLQRGQGQSGYCPRYAQSLCTAKPHLPSVGLLMTDAGNAVIALQTRDYILRQYQVSSLVHATQMRSVWMRKFVNITDNRHSMPMAANVQKRKFARALPDQAWVRDITYIRISFEWPHLVTVLGLYSRKIAVWGMAPWMPEKLVCAALQMAVEQRNSVPGLVVHSSRDQQHASSLHQALLSQHDFLGGMSRKGNCHGYGVLARFLMNLKTERIRQQDYANHTRVTTDVAHYIFIFYKAQLLHSTLGNLYPIVFEHQTVAIKLIEVSKTDLTLQRTHSDF